MVLLPETTGMPRSRARLDDAVCSIGLVDHLHDQVDVPVVEYLVGRRREEGFVDFDITRLFRVADADLHDLRVGLFFDFCTTW